MAGIFLVPLYIKWLLTTMYQLWHY